MSKYHCLHDPPRATYDECFCGKCGKYGTHLKLIGEECSSSKICHCNPITEHPDVQRLIGQAVELQKNLEVWREACGINEKRIEELQELLSELKVQGFIATQDQWQERIEQALKG